MSYTATDTIVAAANVDHSELAEQFDRLIRENGPALNRLASGYANSAGDRDDLVQEIALAVWRALPRFRGECSGRTFLFRIAHNRAMAWLARRRNWLMISESEVVLRDPAPDPEAGMARAQRDRLLSEAIRRLPIAYRQVMMLALEGLEYAEIGQILGISENNAGVRLTRAKQLLKKALEGRA